MNRYLLISLGAILGANARYLTGVWAAERLGPHFPYGTLLVNVCGSFILGCLIAALDGRLLLPSDLRFFLGVAFLGAFTTFSSFSVETLLLLRAGSIGLGLINFLANNLAGLAAAMLGFWLASRLG